MDTLEIRVLGAGDAALVTIPEIGGRRHVLVDAGAEECESAAFAPVLDEVDDVLAGDPIDLYVLTHQHLHQVRGVLDASTRLGRQLEIRHAWITGSADPDYDIRFPRARARRDLAAAAYRRIAGHLAAAGAGPAVDLLRRTNDVLADPDSTSDTRRGIDRVRKLAGAGTCYVDRTAALPALFDETALSAWAPEPDVADYLGRIQPMALGPDPGGAPADSPGPRVPLAPPRGVDAGAFFDLVASRGRGLVDNLLAVDRAIDNASIVLCLEWRGWRLLFPGHAGARSWRVMQRAGALRPVHFLMAGRHGSHTGTPAPEQLDLVLPARPADDRPRSAAVAGPLEGPLALIGKRAAVRRTDEPGGGNALLFEFPAPRGSELYARSA